MVLGHCADRVSVLFTRIDFGGTVGNRFCYNIRSSSNELSYSAGAGPITY